MKYFIFSLFLGFLTSPILVKAQCGGNTDTHRICGDEFVEMSTTTYHHRDTKCIKLFITVDDSDGYIVHNETYTQCFPMQAGFYNTCFEYDRNIGSCNYHYRYTCTVVVEGLGPQSPDEDSTH